MGVVNGRFFLRKRVLVPLGAGVALMVLAWFVLLPWVVRGRVRAVLHQLNVGDATFRVTRATPWSSTVRDIDAGDGNHIDALRVSYSVEGLWNRRVDNIRIEGLQLTADVREGCATIKPLEAMMTAARAASQPATQPEDLPAADASQSDWPFRTVRVDDSMLVVRTPDRSIGLPFSAALRWPQLRAQVADLEIEGSIGDPGAVDLRFRGAGVDGDDLTAVLRAVAPQAPVAVASDVRVSGSLKRDHGTTSLHAEIVAAPQSDGSAEPATKIAGTNVALEEGVFGIAGSFGGGSKSLKVTARDVALAETSFGVKATGVSAEVAMDIQGPATTRPLQVVRAEKLSASKVELTDAVVRFELGADGTLDVHEARADVLGGVLSAQGVRVTPRQPIPVTLALADIELGELLKLLAQGKVTGEGKVNGRLPLLVAPDWSVQLAEGAAEARAGGRLSVTDTAALETIASAAAGGGKGPAAAPQAQVRENVVSALKDFQYESLTAQLKHDPQHGLVAYVRMSGKGRTGAQQALEYDLRVTGLDDLLRSAVGVHRTVTREAARQ